ncbi:hypothetical protein [Dactylosporangium maewongense]
MTRTLFGGLFDDAALFPPGNATMAEAAPAHHRHQASWYADLVGPFICPDTRLSELDGSIAVSVVVTGGPDAVDKAIRQVADGRLAAVEVSGVGDAAAARQAVGSIPSGTRGFIEVPWGPAQPKMLDNLAGSGCAAKLRTGGTVAAAFPTETQLAEAIIGCVARDLPFKCTAGLHHAIRHTAAGTKLEHHGFLNLLLATDAAIDGASRADVIAVLAERTADVIAYRTRQLDSGHIRATRRRFLSYGTCSILEPLEDLAALGLLTAHDSVQVANAPERPS